MSASSTSAKVALAIGALLIAFIPIMLDLLTTHEVVAACRAKGKVQLHSYTIQCKVIE